MWKCPNCEEKIEYLNYSVNTLSYESGTATLRKTKLETNERTNNLVNDWECDDNGDSEWDGEPTFCCCECNEEINLSQLIYIEENEKNEEKPKKEEEYEETEHEIIKPKTQIISPDEERETTDSNIICKKCFHLFISYRNERGNSNYDNVLCECPKCGEVNSTEEFIELLKKGFFNNPKYDPTKEIKHKPFKFMGKPNPKIHIKIQRYKRKIKTNTS